MKNFKIVLIVSLLFSFSNLNFAQIGVSAGYTSVGTNFEIEENLPAFAPSYFFGADYWFRLKSSRVEFYPGVQFLQSSKKTLTNKYQTSETFEHSLKLASAKLNVRIYPFDFEGDCNCPTWSKDGDVFKKGFFVFSTVGAGNLIKTQSSVERSTSSTNEFLFTYGGGIGLDIGLSDFVTISPFVMYEGSTKSEWTLHPCDGCGQLPEKAYLTPFSVGIHTQFRWKKY